MSTTKDLADLFRRDLTRLTQQIQAFPSDQVFWQTLPGITNCAGNLALHLEGNLREYVGRQLGELTYQRKRDQEFSEKDKTREELAMRISDLKNYIPPIIEGLSAQQMDAEYPEVVLKVHISTREYLIHLYGHLNWHLGQIDYLRRALTGEAAIELAGL